MPFQCWLTETAQCILFSTTFIWSKSTESPSTAYVSWGQVSAYLHFKFHCTVFKLQECPKNKKCRTNRVHGRHLIKKKKYQPPLGLRSVRPRRHASVGVGASQAAPFLSSHLSLSTPHLFQVVPTEPTCALFPLCLHNINWKRIQSHWVWFLWSKSRHTISVLMEKINEEMAHAVP